MTDTADWLRKAIKEARERLAKLPEWQQELIRHEVELSND